MEEKSGAGWEVEEEKMEQARWLNKNGRKKYGRGEGIKKRGREMEKRRQ